MDRRDFLKVSGWSFLGMAASGSLLGSCVPGSKEAKKIIRLVVSWYGSFRQPARFMCAGFKGSKEDNAICLKV